ncbi:major facilitator superfamily domain-containing protein [Phakopsora pachyrhizi]|uniref:Major facilitator superfamily domain-containing protein n=1 Tax=Phakopsora pachyrhizi TaxID=170000 RepID=A0AAV0ARX3_PHAPC|nr:major facilitator superfamily domain-containing protein [Phakopsora pachyrhizi]
MFDLQRFRRSVAYTTFVVFFGLSVDLTTYGVVVTVIPFRLNSLGYNDIPSKSSILVSAYGAGLILSSIPCGILGEVFRKRKVTLLSGLLFLVGGSIIFLFSKCFALLVIARVIQGFSGTIVWTIGFALICDKVPESQLASVIGYVMMGWSLGALVGPLVGGALYDSLGFNSILIFNLILAAVDFTFRLFLLEEKKIKIELKKPPRGDKPEVQLAKNTTKSIELPSNTQSGSQAVSNKISSSNAYLALLRSPRCGILFFLVFGLGFTFGGLFDGGITLTLNNRYGLLSREAGLVYIAVAFPPFVSSPLIGFIVGKAGAKWPIVICLIIGAPLLGLQALNIRLWGLVLLVALISFVVMSTSTPILEDLSQVARENPKIGYAHVYSAFNMVYSIGSLLGLLCIGALLQNYGIEKGWKIGCIICSSYLGALIIPAIFLIGRNSKKRNINIKNPIFSKP